MGDGAVGLVIQTQAQNSLTPWIGLIGALVGGGLTAVSNYFVQKLRLQGERETAEAQWQREREAEEARWRREDEDRNIDERRQTYTDFLENARWLLEKVEELDGAIKELYELPEFTAAMLAKLRASASERPASYDEKRLRELDQAQPKIESTMGRIEQLQKDMRWDINGSYTLLTKIEVFGFQHVREAARELFTHNRQLFDSENRMATESVERRRVQLAETERDSISWDLDYKARYESGQAAAEDLRSKSREHQLLFNDAVRKELRIPSL